MNLGADPILRYMVNLRSLLHLQHDTLVEDIRVRRFYIKLILVLRRPPHEEQINELKGILKSCPSDYRNIAGQCIDLIQKVKIDFADQQYSYEMDYMVSNILKLSENHKQLYQRYLNFGTEVQKQNMKAMLNNQMKSINNTLNTLNTFSGNLTILDANAEKSAETAGELKEINKSLQEVIKELDYV